jgi:hypothetical protein
MDTGGRPRARAERPPGALPVSARHPRRPSARRWPTRPRPVPGPGVRRGSRQGRGADAHRGGRRPRCGRHRRGARRRAARRVRGPPTGPRVARVPGRVSPAARRAEPRGRRGPGRIPRPAAHRRDARLSHLGGRLEPGGAAGARGQPGGPAGREPVAPRLGAADPRDQPGPEGPLRDQGRATGGPAPGSTRPAPRHLRRTRGRPGERRVGPPGTAPRGRPRPPRARPPALARRAGPALAVARPGGCLPVRAPRPGRDLGRGPGGRCPRRPQARLPGHPPRAPGDG